MGPHLNSLGNDISFKEMAEQWRDHVFSRCFTLIYEANPPDDNIPGHMLVIDEGRAKRT